MLLSIVWELIYIVNLFIYSLNTAPNGHSSEQTGCWIPSSSYVFCEIQGMDCSPGYSIEAFRGITAKSFAFIFSNGCTLNKKSCR